jgi:hypothetical protein
VGLNVFGKPMTKLTPEAGMAQTIEQLLQPSWAKLIDIVAKFEDMHVEHAVKAKGFDRGVARKLVEKTRPLLVKQIDQSLSQIASLLEATLETKQ